MATHAAKRAELHRMVMENHTCPHGLKALDLLKREGYEVDDHHLTTRAETDAFKAKHDVQSTPQTFIGGKRIGGYDDLVRFFGSKVEDKDAVTYKPVIALFAMAALMALAASWAAFGNLATVQTPPNGSSPSRCLLALQKLKDVEGFATMFLNYDLLAQRWVRICLHLSLRGGARRRPDDLRCPDVGVDPRRAVHRRHRRGLGVQGGLYRQGAS